MSWDSSEDEEERFGSTAGAAGRRDTSNVLSKNVDDPSAIDHANISSRSFLSSLSSEDATNEKNTVQQEVGQASSSHLLQQPLHEADEKGGSSTYSSDSFDSSSPDGDLTSSKTSTVAALTFSEIDGQPPVDVETLLNTPLYPKEKHVDEGATVEDHGTASLTSSSSSSSSSFSTRDDGRKGIKEEKANPLGAGNAVSSTLESTNNIENGTPRSFGHAGEEGRVPDVDPVKNKDSVTDRRMEGAPETHSTARTGSSVESWTGKITSPGVPPVRNDSLPSPFLSSSVEEKDGDEKRKVAMTQEEQVEKKKVEQWLEEEDEEKREKKQVKACEFGGAFPLEDGNFIVSFASRSSVVPPLAADEVRYGLQVFIEKGGIQRRNVEEVLEELFDVHSPHLLLPPLRTLFSTKESGDEEQHHPIRRLDVYFALQPVGKDVLVADAQQDALQRLRSLEGKDEDDSEEEEGGSPLRSESELDTTHLPSFTGLSPMNWVALLADLGKNISWEKVLALPIASTGLNARKTEEKRKGSTSLDSTEKKKSSKDGGAPEKRKASFSSFEEEHSSTLFPHDGNMTLKPEARIEAKPQKVEKKKSTDALSSPFHAMSSPKEEEKGKAKEEEEKDFNAVLQLWNADVIFPDETKKENGCAALQREDNVDGLTSPAFTAAFLLEAEGNDTNGVTPVPLTSRSDAEDASKKIIIPKRKDSHHVEKRAHNTKNSVTAPPRLAEEGTAAAGRLSLVELMDRHTEFLDSHIRLAEEGSDTPSPPPLPPSPTPDALVVHPPLSSTAALALERRTSFQEEKARATATAMPTRVNGGISLPPPLANSPSSLPASTSSSESRARVLLASLFFRLGASKHPRLHPLPAPRSNVPVREETEETVLGLTVVDFERGLDFFKKEKESGGAPVHAMPAKNDGKEEIENATVTHVVPGAGGGGESSSTLSSSLSVSGEDKKASSSPNPSGSKKILPPVPFLLEVAQLIWEVGKLSANTVSHPEVKEDGGSPGVPMDDTPPRKGGNEGAPKKSLAAGDRLDASPAFPSGIREKVQEAWERNGSIPNASSSVSPSLPHSYSSAAASVPTTTNSESRGGGGGRQPTSSMHGAGGEPYLDWYQFRTIVVDELSAVEKCLESMRTTQQRLQQQQNYAHHVRGGSHSHHMSTMDRTHARTGFQIPSRFMNAPKAVAPLEVPDAPPVVCLTLAAMAPLDMEHFCGGEMVQYLRSSEVLRKILQNMLEERVKRMDHPEKKPLRDTQTATIGGGGRGGPSSHSTSSSRQASSKPQWNRPPSFSHVKPRYLQPLPQNEISLSIISRAKERKRLDEQRSLMLPVKQAQMYIRAAIEVKPTSRSDLARCLDLALASDDDTDSSIDGGGRPGHLYERERDGKHKNGADPARRKKRKISLVERVRSNAKHQAEVSTRLSTPYFDLRWYQKLRHQADEDDPETCHLSKPTDTETMKQRRHTEREEADDGKHQTKNKNKHYLQTHAKEDERTSWTPPPPPSSSHIAPEKGGHHHEEEENEKIEKEGDGKSARKRRESKEESERKMSAVRSSYRSVSPYFKTDGTTQSTKSGKRCASYPEGVTVFPIGSFDPASRTSMLSYCSSPHTFTSSFSHSLTSSTPSRMHRSSSEEEKRMSEGEEEKEKRRRKERRKKMEKARRERERRKQNKRTMLSSSHPSAEASQREHERHRLKSVGWSTDEQWQKEKEKYIVECHGEREREEDAWAPSHSSPDFSPYLPKHSKQHSPLTSALHSRKKERGGGVEAPYEKEERSETEKKVHGKEFSVLTSTVEAAMAAITAVHRRTPSIRTVHSTTSFHDATAWEREGRMRRRRRRSNHRASDEMWKTTHPNPHREEVSIHAPAVCYAPKRPPSASSRPPPRHPPQHAPGASQAPKKSKKHHQPSSMPPPRSMAAPLYPATTSHDDSFEHRQEKRQTGGRHGKSTRPPYSRKSPKGWWVPSSPSSRHYKASSSSAEERTNYLSTVPDTPADHRPSAASSGTVPLSPTGGGRPPRHHSQPQPPAPPPPPPHRRSRVSEVSSIDTGLSFDTVVGYTLESDATEEPSKTKEASDTTLSSSSPTVGVTPNRARRMTSPPLGSARPSTSGSAETAVPSSLHPVQPTPPKEERTKKTKKKGGDGTKKMYSPAPSSSGSPPPSSHGGAAGPRGRVGGPTPATSHAAPISTHPSVTHTTHPHTKKKKEAAAAAPTVAHSSSQRISILSFTGSSDLELAIPTSEASEPPPPPHPQKEKEKNALLSPPETEEEKKKTKKTTTKKTVVVPRPPSGEKKNTTAESAATKKKKIAAPPSKPAATKSSTSKPPPPPPPPKGSTKPPLSPHSSSTAKKPDHSESGGSGASSAEKAEDDMREALKRLSISSFNSSSLLHSVEKVGKKSSPGKHAKENGETAVNNDASNSSLRLSGELSQSTLQHSKDTLDMAKMKKKPAVTPLIPDMYVSSSSYASLPSVSLSSAREAEEPGGPASVSHPTPMTVSASTMEQNTFSSLKDVALSKELPSSSVGSSSPKHPTQTTDLYSSDGPDPTVGAKKKKKRRSTSEVSAFSSVSADTEESTSLAADPSETLVTEGGIGSKKPLLYHPHVPLRGKQVPQRPVGKAKHHTKEHRHSNDVAEPSGGTAIPAAGGGAVAARVLELESGSKIIPTNNGRDSEPSMLGSLNTSLHYRRTSLLSRSTSPSPATPGEFEGETLGNPTVSVEPHTLTAGEVLSASSSSVSSDTEEEETNEAAKMGAFLDGSLMLSPDKKGGGDRGNSASQLSSSPLDGSVKVRPRTSLFVQTDEESKEVEASTPPALKTSGQCGEKRESQGGQEATQKVSVHSPSSGFTPQANGVYRPSVASPTSSAGSSRTPVLFRRGSVMTNELQMGLPGVTRLGSGTNSRSRRLSQYSHGMASVSAMGSGSGVMNGNGSVTEGGRSMNHRNSISLSSNRSFFSVTSQSGKQVRPTNSGSMSNGYDGMNAFGASNIRGRLSLSAARTSQTNGSPMHDSKSGLGSVFPSNSGSGHSTGMADVWKDDLKETVDQQRQEQRPQENIHSGMGLPGRPSISLNASSPTTAGVSA